MFFTISQKRVKRFLSSGERLDIIFRYNSGQSATDIANDYGISRQAVYAIHKKTKRFGTTEDRPRSGRPRHTTRREDSQIYMSSVKSPKKTPKLIKQNLDLNVSIRTVRRRMNERGLRPHLSATVSYISDINRKKRLEFAKKMSLRPKNWWTSVIWSDEKKFELMHARRRVIVNRRVGQRYQIKFTKPTMKFGGGSLMLWGCFSRNGVGSLVEIDGRLEQHKYRYLLEDNLHYSAHLMGLGDNFVFQQDLCRIHTAPAVKDFFTENSIEVMDWVPQSPDFNPIENLWSCLDSNVPIKERCNKTRFMSALLKTWNDLPLDLIKNLVDSVPNRLAEAIRARGGHTHY